MVEVVVWFIRVITFVSTIALAGGLLFLLFAWPEGSRSARLVSLLKKAWALALVVTLVSPFFQGPYVTGRGITAITDINLLGDVLNARFGLLIGVRIIVLATLLWLLHAGLRRPVRDRPTGIFIGVYVAVLLATVSFGGHAGTGTTLTMVVHTVHLLAASAWLGGLLVLFRVVLPHVGPQHLLGILPPFSNLATVSVAALVVTGTYQAIVQAGSLSDVFAGQWGALLFVKGLVVAGLLGLGFFSRRWTRDYVGTLQHTNGAASNERALRKKLRINLGREAAVGLGVLAVTAWLVSSTPPVHEDHALVKACPPAMCERA
jgi:copper transport protein